MYSYFICIHLHLQLVAIRENMNGLLPYSLTRLYSCLFCHDEFDYYHLIINKYNINNNTLFP